MANFVYMVRCADDSLYTGFTNDLTNRLKLHNEGKGAKYTRARRPVRLVLAAQYSSAAVAQGQERAIKKLSRFRKEELIEWHRSVNKWAKRVELVEELLKWFPRPCKRKKL